ncbi:hypothetical protein CA11_26540 [Gimesia maris]|uniref:hypothetical protein n=1 Tax=Gimesia maris TaxID=122 RepID=UPI00118A4A88|nr:hypothetical protein [Gimesia maris]QDU14843.1 hypothetical protein CA11_26540 [Gimesia maris]
MSSTVLDKNTKIDDIGILFRNKTKGPEEKLVDWFLDEVKIQKPRGSFVTYFREPKILSGFPDVVVVVWNLRTAMKWASERSNLTEKDIRLLHHIVQDGPCSEDKLIELFSSEYKGSLNRLNSARMIRSVNKKWISCSLSNLFATSRIIAIEAKISNWSSGVNQASLNTWFASESYVLLPHVPRGSKVVTKASKRGVGVWTRKDGIVNPASNDTSLLPRSFASWQFNEWAWRAHKIGAEKA